MFEDALDRGFLGSPEGASAPFALMWANRMPRHVLPVRRAAAPVIERHRLVSSDVDDFVAFVDHLAERYFVRPNYLRVEGRLYLSIFDSTFFVKELGLAGAAEAIARARGRLRDRGLPDLHLAAVDPSAAVIGRIRELGFDSVTHYVLLPEWKGPFLQDYDACARRRAAQWPELRARVRAPVRAERVAGLGRLAARRRLRHGSDLGSTRGPRSSWTKVPPGSTRRSRGRCGMPRARRRRSRWRSSHRSTSGARGTTSSPTPGSGPGGWRPFAPLGERACGSAPGSRCRSECKRPVMSFT